MTIHLQASAIYHNHSRHLDHLNTGIINTINNGCIPLRWSSSRALVVYMLVCLLVQLNLIEPSLINVINYNCALPAVTNENVRC